MKKFILITIFFISNVYAQLTIDEINDGEKRLIEEAFKV